MKALLALHPLMQTFSILACIYNIYIFFSHNELLLIDLFFSSNEETYFEFLTVFSLFLILCSIKYVITMDEKNHQIQLSEYIWFEGRNPQKNIWSEAPLWIWLSCIHPITSFFRPSVGGVSIFCWLKDIRKTFSTVFTLQFRLLLYKKSCCVIFKTSF